MKLYLGQHVDQRTGVVKERYLILGRAIKNSELTSVGDNATPILRFTISPGRGEDLANVTAWADDATRWSPINKGDSVLADVLEQPREYNGKVYMSYTPLNLMVWHVQEAARRPAPKKNKREPAPPSFGDLSDTAFTDIPESGFADIPEGFFG